MLNFTRHVSLLIIGMALSLGSIPLLAQDIVIDSGADETVIPRLSSAPAQTQLVCSDPANGTLGPCGGANRVPFWIRIYGSNPSFDGNLTLFLQSSYRVCIGAIPDCTVDTGTYTVPANTYLQIEEASMTARVLVGSQPSTASGQVRLAGSDGTALYYLGNLDLIDPGLNIWQEGRPLSVVAPSGFELKGRIDWSQSGGSSVEGTLYLSGHMIITQ